LGYFYRTANYLEASFMVKITAVIPGDNHILTVRFDNDQDVTVDFTNKLYTLRFGELRKPEDFRTAKTDGRSVYWPKGLAISVSEIIELAAKNQEATYK
jgi:Protein of unknown function (DUF2442).